MDTLTPSLARIRGISALWLLLSLLPAAFASYSIGVGRADSTGPAAEIVFVSIRAKLCVKKIDTRSNEKRKINLFQQKTTKIHRERKNSEKILSKNFVID